MGAEKVETQGRMGWPRTRAVDIAANIPVSQPPTPEHWKKFMASEAPVVTSYQDIIKLPTPQFLAHINQLVVQVVESPDYEGPDGYMSAAAWKRLVDGGILAQSLGDRNRERRQEEIARVSEIASYHDINAGLSFGITTGLSLLTLQRFGNDAQKEKFIGRIRNGEMMGYGITERDSSGSSALEMTSSYKKDPVTGKSALKSAKHFQGLSGHDLIIAALKEDSPVRTVGLFVVDKEDIITELKKTPGLSKIPYGINVTRDGLVLDADRLLVEIPRSGFLSDFRDMFTKSRVLFVSMVLGHQERMIEEAKAYAAVRIIDGKPQIEKEVVQHTLLEMETRRAISEAIGVHAASYRIEGESLLHADTENYSTEASTVKVLTTEYAHATANDRATLMGSLAYYDQSAMQDVLNIWPFRIFEGPEPMLYSQIGSDAIKNAKRGKPEVGLIEDATLDLDFQTQDILGRVRARLSGATKVQEEIYGQIAARIFALGCCELTGMESTQYEKAKEFLSVEIVQRAHKFLSIKNRSADRGELSLDYPVDIRNSN